MRPRIPKRFSKETDLILLGFQRTDAKQGKKPRRRMDRQTGGKPLISQPQTRRVNPSLIPETTWGKPPRKPTAFLPPTPCHPPAQTSRASLRRARSSSPPHPPCQPLNFIFFFKAKQPEKTNPNRRAQQPTHQRDRGESEQRTGVGCK